MEYGCIGEHLSHSFSREIHKLLGDYSYEIHEVAPDALKLLMTARAFRAINVTIPYKEQVIPYLSRMSDSAAHVGAVNTIVNRDGELYGYNTDYTGMCLLAKKAGIDFFEKKVLILGTGGTSKTALAVVHDAKASRVHRVSRTGKEDAVSYAQAYRDFSDTEIIINTTPCGMFPDTEPMPIDISRFPCLVGVLDAIYHPLNTKLIQAAKERHLQCAGGLYMLVAQAVAASDIFMGTFHEEKDIDRIYSMILNQKRNLVLIGMPCCGKTTVGSLLAQDIGQPFLDTDQLLEKETGCSPADFIRAKGIDAVRDVESAVIREVSSRNGCVIAVGGGAVCRRQNVIELKKNGTLLWLDRSLSLLRATPDRPLTDSYDKLIKVYQERLPLYKASADIIIRSDADAPERVKIIEKECEYKGENP